MPRRWGKTINLEMLKNFLEFPVGPDGAKLNRTATLNFKLFSGVAQVGRAPRKMKICQEKLTFLENDEYVTKDALDVLGTYPVIHIFSKIVLQRAVASIKEALRGVLFHCFEQHCYHAYSDKLAKIDKEMFLRYAVRKCSKTLDDDDIMSGLSFLGELLFKHHNRKVWILIDEYDAGLNTAYRRHLAPDLDATIDFFTKMLGSALKSNPNLEKGVMTGILREAKTGMLSALNSLKVFDFTDAKYAQYYGLDDEEVDCFIEHFGVPEDQRKDAKKWYNGYTVKSYSPTNPEA